jgi:predicted Zn-dependent protease
LASAGDNAAAIAEYRKVVEAKPGYLAAHFALAGLLAKSGDSEGALQELRELAKQEPQNSSVFEQIGDAEAARQHTSEAAAAYKSALSLAPDRETRKRVNDKLKLLPH